MKNRLLITLVAVLSLLAAGCASAAEVATEAETATIEVVETTAAPEELVEPETTTAAPEAAEEAETTTAAPPDTEPSTNQTTTPAAASEETTGDIDGMAIYESNCVRCHSADGSGGRGSDIQGISVEQPETTSGIEVVTNGGQGMPAFADDLTAEEIEAVINYVWETF